MRIEWFEDITGGTEEHRFWTLRGRAGDVVVEVRSPANLNRSTRYLEKLRLEVLDGVRGGLGLPEYAIREEDIGSVPAAMGALRRMAEEASR